MLLLVGCAKSSPVHSVEQVDIAKPPVVEAAPLDPAPKTDSTILFAQAEERFLASKHRYSTIVRDLNSFEASDTTRYYFDANLNLVWIDRDWHVEGVEGRYQFQIDALGVVCLRIVNKDQSNEEVAVFCKSDPSPKLSEADIDSGVETAADEVGLLVAALLDQQENPSMVEGCSTETAGDVIPLGPDNEYQSMTSLSVPNTLCVRMNDLLRALGATRE